MYVDNKDNKSRLDRIEDSLKELSEGNIKKKKEKEFKLPWSSRVGGTKAKKNYVTVGKINENGSLVFSREPIVEQTIIIDGIPRLATGEHILHYKKNPVIIIPSWSVEPFTPSENYKNSLNDGSNSAGYRLIMNRMQGEAIKLGKKIGGLGITIGAIIVGGIIAYALWKG